MSTNFANFPKTLDRIEALAKTLHANQLNQLNDGEKVMATLDDLNKAVSDVQAAVAAAVTLITSMHSSPNTVTDAEVEAAVTKLEAAASALGGAQPGP